ncbi:MAG: hypothetical protein UU93_C0011G0020 [Candidatus Amesbacteria bacterium GW2011_GWA2_42_12]|uniref:Uncharacterized protein n=1 Tax=Candidatus Amesbacteria bacterium GW2011_GWA2_42_12 TaxID=1618356 RepID=A0A0G0Y5N7_9BACT|nr:MAG: hypothetical protein UU93_C0011G0020 [Candidatus Amesbacteria bacterium GW2011_GWA2_42_12]
MLRVFHAPAAVFGKGQFIRSVDLILFGNIVLRFANTAHETNYLSCAFLCHFGILPKKTLHCNVERVFVETNLWLYGWLFYGWNYWGWAFWHNWGCCCGRCSGYYGQVFCAAVFTHPNGFAIVSNYLLAV